MHTVSPPHLPVGPCQETVRAGRKFKKVATATKDHARPKVTFLRRRAAPPRWLCLLIDPSEWDYVSCPTNLTHMTHGASVRTALYEAAHVREATNNGHVYLDWPAYPHSDTRQVAVMCRPRTEARASLDEARGIGKPRPVTEAGDWMTQDKRGPLQKPPFCSCCACNFASGSANRHSAQT